MPDLVEQRRDPRAALGRGVAEERREVVEQFLGRQVVVEVRVLGKVADAPPTVEIADGPAEDLGAAGGREDQLHQQLERGGLARAVRAEKAEDLAGLDRERQAVERAVRALAPEADRVVLRELSVSMAAACSSEHRQPLIASASDRSAARLLVGSS